METEPAPSAQLLREGLSVEGPTPVVEGGDGPMTKAQLRVGKPVARVADGLLHNRDRRRHIKQFQRVTRVTLRQR